MRELEAIEQQVEVATLSLGERVQRIYDALHALHDLTLATFSMTPRDPDRVAAWLGDAGFGLDEQGYFERLEVLARARAGASDPGTQTYYANEAISNDPEAVFRMYAIRELPRVVRGIKTRLPGLAWVYYQDATGFAMTHPMHDPSTVVPADFDWHSYFTYESVSPEVNPKREIRWTPPNIDYGGKGLMVSASIPLYADDELIGVWSFDVPVRSLVYGNFIAPGREDQSVFIVDRDGYLVAHDTMETLVAPEGGNVHREHLRSLGGDFGDLDVTELISRGRGHLELVDGSGASRYAVYGVVEQLDWLVVVTVPTQDVVARTRALFDASPMGIALVDPKGLVVETNAELARIVALPPSAFLGQALGDLLQGDIRSELEALLETTLASGAGGPSEGTIRSGTDDPTPVRVVTRRIGFSKEPAVLVAFEDMTERKRLQAQLLQTQKIQAIGQLAGGVAHDFNNLLTAILGSASLLRMRAPESYHELIDSIVYASERAAAITGRLLAFSRREMVQPTRIYLPELLRGLELLLTRLVGDDVIVAFELEGDVPTVHADPGQMEQIVMNLVLNARDALPEGGRIDVRLRRCEEGPPAACLSVEDNGVGMSEATRARVLEPFFTTKAHGTGLGLATVDEVVRLCGGSLKLDSKLGEGTQVHVRLPAAAETEDDVAAPAPASKAIALNGLVLVVDDEPLVRQAAQRLLEDQGLRVQGAANAEQALEHLERGEVELVLSDVVMPGLSGRELMERCRSRWPTVAVVLMSGYTDDHIVRSGVDALNVPLVRKPFTLEQLLDAFTRALNAARRSAQPSSQ